MTLNHLNLTVTDVTAARDFLEKYLGLHTMTTRGQGFAVLRDDGGLILTLMRAAEASYPKTFHIGFGQESAEKVNEINQRLRDDGFDVAPPQRSHAWTFYVNAPGGFLVEILSA